MNPSILSGLSLVVKENRPKKYGQTLLRCQQHEPTINRRCSLSRRLVCFVTW